jgi:hypothetical protein
MSFRNYLILNHNYPRRCDSVPDSVRLDGRCSAVQSPHWGRFFSSMRRPQGLGPVDIHRTHIIAPTKKSMDRYDSAVFSYRVAILR